MLINAKTSILLVAAVFLASVFAFGANIQLLRAQEEESDEVTLKIGGDEGTEFSGTCTIGDEEEDVEGQVSESFEFELDGQELECELRKQDVGDLKITLSGDGTRAMQRVSSSKATIKFTYDDGSVSFSTTSSSGSGGQVTSSQVVSSSSSQTIRMSSSARAS